MSKTVNTKDKFIIEGTIVCISHLFYLSGKKTFFLNLNRKNDKKDEKPTFLMIDNAKRTQDLQEILVQMQLKPNHLIGKRVIVKNLSKIRINVTGNSSEIGVYAVNQATSFEIKEEISNFFPKHNFQDIVNYEGILSKFSSDSRLHKDFCLSLHMK